MNVIARIQRARSLLSLAARRDGRQADAYFLVTSGGPKGVVASSCAAILDMPFDCVDPFDDAFAGPARQSVLLAVTPRSPSDDEIAAMVRRVTDRADGSIIVIEARGRRPEDFAGVITRSSPNVLAVAEDI